MVPYIVMAIIVAAAFIVVKREKDISKPKEGQHAT